MEANGVDDDNKMLYFGLEPPESGISAAVDEPELHAIDFDEPSTPLSPLAFKDIES